MKNSRLKLQIAVLAIITYMISALIWWAFALIQFQERQYSNEMEKLEMKKTLAMEKMENLFSSGRIKLQNVAFERKESAIIFVSTEKNNVDLSNHKTIYNNTLELIKSSIITEFSEFNVISVTNKQRNQFEIRLQTKPELLFQVRETLRKKKMAWIGEGLTLGFITILIGIAMYLYLDKIIRLNAQQNNFLLAVTHELKTPIAATKLALQTIKKDSSQKLLPKMLEMANSNVIRLSQMVEQILMATRFESKFTDPLMVEIDLHDEIQTTLSAMELSAEINSRIKIDVPEGILMQADEKMIQTVFRNLITNAIKYADEGEIKIEAHSSSDWITIIFSDLGMGIPDTEKKKVFEKFYRVGEEKTRTKPGSGLGLYLVKKITEMHDGKVTIDDNFPQGTRFILTFKQQQQTIA
jgi:two-component system, OmpR family, sensor histidine kinase CiaH